MIVNQPLIMNLPPNFTIPYPNGFKDFRISKLHIILLKFKDQNKNELNFIIQNLKTTQEVANIKCLCQSDLQYDFSPNHQFFVYFGTKQDFTTIIVIRNLFLSSDFIVQCPNEIQKLEKLQTYRDYFLILTESYDVIIYNYQGQIVKLINLSSFLENSSPYEKKYMKNHINDRISMIDNPLFIKRILGGYNADLQTEFYIKTSQLMITTKLFYLEEDMDEQNIFLNYNNQRILRKFKFSQWFGYYPYCEYERTTINLDNYLATYFSRCIHIIDYCTGLKKSFEQKEDRKRILAFEGKYYVIKDKLSIHIWSEQSLIKERN